MSTSKDAPKINIKVENSQFTDFTELKAHSKDEKIEKENHTQAPPRSDPVPAQSKQEERKADSEGIRKTAFFSQKSKQLTLKHSKAVELEDGEVSDGDSDNEEDPQPVCRFYLRNSCTWGNNCRFRHSGSTDLGNYVMFESVQLPLPPAVPDMYEELPPPSRWIGYQDELESSFDTNLRSLKQLMRQAGYKVDNRAGRVRYQHQPWVEFNDLDTDPYYTQLLDQPLEPGTDHSSQMSLASKCSSTPTDSQDELDFSALSSISSSSSSTPDYSSTTDSESSAESAGFCRKRKHTMEILWAPSRRFSSSSSSDTDSSSYSSTTYTSELSSSSMELHSNRDLNRRYKSHQEPPCKYCKYEKIHRSRREYMKRKLRYVEKKF